MLELKIANNNEKYFSNEHKIIVHAVISSLIINLITDNNLCVRVA